MFLESGPGDAEYTHWLNIDLFMQVAPGILAYGKRKNNKFVRQLREVLIVYKYPTIDEVFEKCDYAETTVAQLKSGLRKLPYFVNDRLTEIFFEEYYRVVNKYHNMKDELVVSKLDSDVLDRIELNQLYVYKDIVEILKNNSNIDFVFPKEVVTSDLDYTKSEIQYVQFNHIGVNTAMPYLVEYAYHCKVCGATVRYDELPKSLKCPINNCSGKLKREEIDDTVALAYASQVMAKQQSVPAVSLVEMPTGEFTAAVLVCRDIKSTSYYVLVLAIEEKVYECTQLDIRSGEHAVWQLIDIIDDIHQERTSYHINGMDYYKAAVLMAAIANASGFKSYNILIAGKPGGAKTVTPRWYHNTFSLMCKLQDVVSLSLPGVVGSTSMISVNNRNIQIRELGLLSRYEFVILDELYNKVDDSLMGKLKGALSTPTISKEVHGNRSESDKNASVVATANISPAIYNASRNKFNEYIRDYLANPDSYYLLNDYAKQAYELLRFDRDPVAIVSKTMELECAAEGLNWIDGQALADLERFGLIFYVGNPVAGEDNSVPDHIFDDTDSKITTPALQSIVYSQEIRDYIQYCGNIKVVIDDEMLDRVREFVSEIWSGDHVHSKARGMRNIFKTLELSAMICGRDYLNDMDFEFVKQLFDCTCHWIEIDDLRRRHGEECTAEHSHGRREPDPHEVGSFIDKRFKRYDLYGEGRSFWERGLMNISCDIITEFGIDDPVIAQKHIEDYIKKNAPADANTFDVHMIPSDAPDVVEYFKKIEGGMEIGEFRDLLMNEFAKKKEIPKSELGLLCEKCKVDVGVLNDQLGIMKRRSMLADAGDSFKWVG